MKCSIRATVAFVVFTTMTMSILAQPQQQSQGFIGITVGESEKPPGILAKQIVPNSPAAKAGVKAGDVIIRIGGVQVKEVQTFLNIIKDKTIGQKVTLLLVREGLEQQVTVTVEAIPLKLLRENLQAQLVQVKKQIAYYENRVQYFQEELPGAKADYANAVKNSAGVIAATFRLSDIQNGLILAKNHLINLKGQRDELEGRLLALDSK